jgi:nicotinate (nicotinamide) nucleotide adenylyltransferase
MKRVGIFAGAFDPVHEGHLKFAQEALTKGRLDKVFFLVEPRPRRKQGVKSFEHRINMVKLAIENELRFGLIVLEQARFSVLETLPLLISRFKGSQINLLLGEDVAAHLVDWPHIDELINSVHFVIGIRNNKTDLNNHIKTIEKTRGLSFNYTTFKTRLSKINSSEIRLALRQGQNPGGLDPKVATYIKKHGLYVPSDSS